MSIVYAWCWPRLTGCFALNFLWEALEPFVTCRSVTFSLTQAPSCRAHKDVLITENNKVSLLLGKNEISLKGVFDKLRHE